MATYSGRYCSWLPAQRRERRPGGADQHGSCGALLDQVSCPAPSPRSGCCAWSASRRSGRKTRRQGSPADRGSPPTPCGARRLVGCPPVGLLALPDAAVARVALAPIAPRGVGGTGPWGRSQATTIDGLQTIVWSRAPDQILQDTYVGTVYGRQITGSNLPGVPLTTESLSRP
jgi:hypothetical protein